jgi:hypothetical protein
VVLLSGCAAENDPEPVATDAGPERGVKLTTGPSPIEMCQGRSVLCYDPLGDGTGGYFYRSCFWQDWGGADGYCVCDCTTTHF